VPDLVDREGPAAERRTWHEQLVETEVLCSADTGERWCTVCTAVVVKHQARAAAEILLAGTSDARSGGVQNSLKLVGRQ